MRTKKFMFTTAIVAVLLFEIWTVRLMLTYPSAGIRIEPNSMDAWVVTQIDSFSAGQKVGIEIGDIITEVNGGEPQNHWAVKRFRSLDQAKTIVAEKDGAIFHYNLDYGSTLDYWDILTLVFEFMSLWMSWLIYRKIRNSPSSRLLSAVFFLIFIALSAMEGSVRSDPSGKIIMMSTMMLIPAILYHFFTVFIQEKGGLQLQLRVFPRFYLLVAPIVALMGFYYWSSPYTYTIYRFAMRAGLAVTVIGIGLNFILLLYTYIRNKSNAHLILILKTLLFTLVCSLFPVTILSFAPKVLFETFWVDPLYTSAFIFLFPFSFIYLLATRRLYDIDMIVRRTVMAATIALIPCLLFIAIAKLTLGDRMSYERLTLLFFILMAGSTSVLYSLEMISTRLQPVLFPRRHQLQQTLKKISKNLETTSTFQELRDIILVDIVSTLQVHGGAIIFRYADRVQSITDGELDQAEVEGLLLAGKLEEHPFYTFMEISQQEEYISYLVITQKKSSALLGTEEIQWLNLIITYLGVSLENVQLIGKLDEKLQRLSLLLPNEKDAEQLIWFRKLMFEMQEKERIRIAMDIHDTTMQDLFLLKSRLVTLQDTYELNENGKTYVEELLEYIDIINTGLRQSCFELHPHLLREIGLVGTLRKVFQIERSMCDFTIEFSTSEVSAIEEQDMGVKRHLFRIVQELMNNAKKYSHASLVSMAIRVEGAMITFNYEDDGIGFEPGRPVVREIGSSGMGMEQIKSRVQSLGGKYELRSATGKGVVFQARFPLKKGG